MESEGKLVSLGRRVGRLIAVFLLVFLFSGCSTTGPVPSDWRPLDPESEAVIETPVGRFSNLGKSDNEKIKAPTLSALLFDELIEGFDLDNIEFSKFGSMNGKLLIKPHVGDVAIAEQRFFEAERKRDGTLVWTAKTKTSFADAYVVSASVMWTGGALMPLAEWKRYQFQVADDGALLIHLKSSMLVNFFYFFPVPLTDEVWLQYPAYRDEELGVVP